MTKIKKQILSENYYNERKDKITGKPIAIDMLVLHCSAYPSEKLIPVFKDLGVSAHYLIDQDGSITQLVEEEKRAWHAGVGSWKGVSDINSHSIGIEVINPTFGHSEPYTSAQIKSLIELSKKIIKKYHILPHNVFAHSDMAPLRKFDPGRLFPWAVLAKEGIGLWFDEKDQSIKETDAEKLMSDIGYSIDSKEASLRAFLRHYMPEYIPDKENPQMDQYQFLLEYDKNLPEVMKKEIPLNDQIIKRLNQVANAFQKSRQKKFQRPNIKAKQNTSR